MLYIHIELVTSSLVLLLSTWKLDTNNGLAERPNKDSSVWQWPLCGISNERVKVNAALPFDQNPAAW